MFETALKNARSLVSLELARSVSQPSISPKTAPTARSEPAATAVLKTTWPRTARSRSAATVTLLTTKLVIALHLRIGLVLLVETGKSLTEDLLNDH